MDELKLTDGFKVTLSVFAASLIYNYKKNERFRAITDTAFETLCKDCDDLDEAIRALSPCFEGIADRFCEDLEKYAKED